VVPCRIGDRGLDPEEIGAGRVVCLTGVERVGSPAGVGDMAAAAVLKNNGDVGSVNANKRHWYKANDRWLASTEVAEPPDHPL